MIYIYIYILHNYCYVHDLHVYIILRTDYYYLYCIYIYISYICIYIMYVPCSLLRHDANREICLHACVYVRSEFGLNGRDRRPYIRSRELCSREKKHTHQKKKNQNRSRKKIN